MPPNGPFVTRDGYQLVLSGKPYQFSGANIHNADSDGYCSFHHTEQELRDAFEAIESASDATAYPEGGAVVRAWFFQPMAMSKEEGATNDWSGAQDWSKFERTLAIAQQTGSRSPSRCPSLRPSTSTSCRMRSG